MLGRKTTKVSLIRAYGLGRKNLKMIALFAKMKLCLGNKMHATRFKTRETKYAVYKCNKKIQNAQKVILFGNG